MSGDGVRRRLLRVLPRRGSMVLPLDGGLIDGPLGALADSRKFLTRQLLENFDAVLAFRGLLKTHQRELQHTAFIANLSGSTALSTHTFKRQIASVESAIRAGADAVCFQIHLSDSHEGSMLRDLGKVINHAERWGLPVIAIAYPRRGTAGADDDYAEVRQRRPSDYTRLVSHVVRVAVEMGVDAVKTTYTGTAESFAEVVASACGVPVLVSGGAMCPDSDALAKAKAATIAGAWGTAYGRQIFLHEDPVGMARRLREAVDSGLSSRGTSQGSIDRST
jgi:fructose-bisphosphate aldolase/2-amino-3,7-dideoxy-D-threo-hept-6-ulosonate synthase